ncbi:GAF domain-containing protein [Longimicrobium sp.]|uniref:GAF domain-containing protein n=1 Tax=Longimicrobium sp. TaxID=2029185 RepID=UPI002EDAF252
MRSRVSLANPWARDEDNLRVLRALGIGSVIVVPLIARGSVLGALTLVSADSGHPYAPADLELAEDLGARCAMAIDNARLHRDARSAGGVRRHPDYLASRRDAAENIASSLLSA